MKNGKRFLTAALTLIIAVSLLGCNGDDDGDDGPVTLLGTWDADTATVTSPQLPGGPVTVSSSLGMLTGVVTFNADGTFTADINISMIGESYSFSGTWSASDSELKITSAGESGEGSYALSGSTLVVTYERDGDRIVVSASKR